MTKWKQAGINYAIMTILAVAQAFAQECSAILQHGLRNISISQSEDARVASTYFNNCGTDFSTMSDAQIATAEVSIFGVAGGSGGYTRSQRNARLQQWCTANETFAQSHQREYRMAQDIFAPAVEAWNTCNSLVADHVQIRPTITPDDQTVDIRINYTGIAENVKLQAVATENFTCNVHSAQGSRQSLPVTLGPSLVNLNCRRAPATSETLNGSAMSKFSRGTISVLTADHSLQLFFPEKWNPAIPQGVERRLTDQLNTLTEQYRQLSTKADAQDAQITNVTNALTLQGGATKYIISQPCPSGWTDLGEIAFLWSVASFSSVPSSFRKGGNLTTDAAFRWVHPRMCGKQ